MSAVLNVTIITASGEMKVQNINFQHRWDADDARKELLAAYEAYPHIGVIAVVLKGGSV